MTDKPPLDSLTTALLAVAPEWSPAQQNLSIHLYRLLSEGQPVTRERLALAADISPEVVGKILDGCFRFHFDDADGRIEGFLGLALPEMLHRFEVAGRRLYTWCAWDSLLIPAIIQETARVLSHCQATGAKIRLTVSPDGIKDVTPAGTVISFMIPEIAKSNENPIAGLCHYVHFFSSAHAGQGWVSERKGLFVLSLEEAYELGRRWNAALYGNIAGA